MEEAFYTTDSVMTVSFHKYGEYFPGTGDLRVNVQKSKNSFSVLIIVVLVLNASCLITMRTFKYDWFLTQSLSLILT